MNDYIIEEKPIIFYAAFISREHNNASTKKLWSYMDIAKAAHNLAWIIKYH